MNKIAFTSDQHYWHTNILSERLCNRPFDNIVEHNEALISNHNTVAYDDSWECGSWEIFLINVMLIEPLMS